MAFETGVAINLDSRSAEAGAQRVRAAIGAIAPAARTMASQTEKDVKRIGGAFNTLSQSLSKPVFGPY